MSAEADEKLDLPRLQGGFRPQHLLLTLLGDYWYDRDEHLPSAGLVRLLAEFDVSSAGSRAALSRLARRALLESSRRGRNTYYGLSQRAAALLAEGRQRILSFGSPDRREWNGEWTLIAFSVPEEQRGTRHVLRTRLRWLGFAPLYDGVWVSPRGDVDAITNTLADLSIDVSTVMTGRLAGGNPKLGHPIRAWDLDRLRSLYEEFVRDACPLVERVRAGQVGAAEGLVARTRVMDTWRNFPNLDPDLPCALLPERWPGPDARTAFVELYDGLGPLAEMRVRQILAEVSPELAGLVRHHTTAGTARS